MTIAPSLCSPLALADAEPTRAAEPWESDVLTAYGLLREAAAELDHLMRHSLKRSGLQMAMFELLLRLARSHGEKQRLTSLARELTVTLAASPGWLTEPRTSAWFAGSRVPTMPAARSPS